MTRDDPEPPPKRRAASTRPKPASGKRAKNLASSTRAAAGTAVPRRPIRVLIADDHEMFREALRRLLATERDVEVVGEAKDGSEVLRLVSTIAADVLLLDLEMPGRTGLEVLERLTERRAAIRTILLTANVERPQQVRAIRSGARGIVGKDAPLDLLMKSIRQVASGHYWIGHEQMGDLIESVVEPEQGQAIDNLTPRERQLIGAITQGATNKQIAEQLRLSPQTIKNLLSNIFGKLGVSNRLELALFAVEHRISPTDAS